VLYKLGLLTLLALATVMAVGLANTSLAAQPETEAAQDAIDYIRTLQNPDGGFPGTAGEESSPGSTVDAVFALVAAGIDPATVQEDGGYPEDYLRSQAAAYSEDPGAGAKLFLGVVALGEDPRDFGGVDLLAALDAGFDASSGRFGIDLFDHGLFMLARASAGLGVPDAAVSYLKSKQLDDGGWEFDEGWGADTNTTALAIQALIAAGEDPSSAAVQGGLAYLAAAQNDDGGFPYSPESEYGTDSDANSTAVVIQALAAAGEDIGAGGPWDKGEGRTPLAALLSFQNAETGAFTFDGQDSAFATYQAVPGLLLAPLPVATTTLEEEAVPAPAAPSATPGVAVVTIPAAGQGPGEGRQGAALPLATALAAGGLLAAGSGLLLRLRRG